MEETTQPLPDQMADLGLDGLLDLKASLDQAIAAKHRERQAEALANIAGIARRAELSPAEVAQHLRKARQQAGAARPRAKLPPKFRDPRTGAAWSGRGKQPVWLRDQLAAGAKLDDFRLTMPEMSREAPT